jgi:hypothetical protein
MQDSDLDLELMQQLGGPRRQLVMAAERRGANWAASEDASSREPCSAGGVVGIAWDFRSRGASWRKGSTASGKPDQEGVGELREARKSRHRAVRCVVP